VLKQIKIETFKLSRRLRSYIGFFGVIGIVALVTLGVHYEPPEDVVRGMAGGQFTVVGTFINASFLAGFVMPLLFYFFMPLFVSLVAGDIVAGEAAEGTLRTQLTRPVTRLKFLLSKYIVSVLYSFVLTLFLGIFAYILGAIVFGQGSLLQIDGDHGVSIFPKYEGIVRLLFGYCLAALGMRAIATIAFFLSTLVSNSLGPVGIAMMSLVVFTILGEIPYFDWLKPYLFTTHMQLWRDAFRVPVPLNELRTSLLALAAYVGVFLIGSVLVFRRKDILT
jgi:ABC-2 type transport system permease protein